MSGFYTADGDMKAPKKLGALSKAGRASQIVVSSEGFGNDHFTTTSMNNNHKLATSSMVVKKRIPPNKNQGSEPGVPWSSNDHPASDTFKTSNELRTKVVANSRTEPRRPPVEGARSTVKLGKIGPAPFYRFEPSCLLFFFTTSSCVHSAWKDTKRRGARTLTQQWRCNNSKTRC